MASANQEGEGSKGKKETDIHSTCFPKVDHPIKTNVSHFQAKAVYPMPLMKQGLFQQTGTNTVWPGRAGFIWISAHTR